MNSFVLSPGAEEDVFEIWSYLANEVNVEFANQIESSLFDAFALLIGDANKGFTIAAVTRSLDATSL